MSAKLPTLDGLRAVSIIFVLSGHLLPLGPKALQLNGAVATMGMAIFFSLSGFLITTNLLNNQSVAVFFVRRGARILPLAYLYLLVAAIVVGPTATTVLENLTFIENYTYAWMLTEHFWSLCVEIHFYIAAGLTVLLFGKRGLWLVPIACVAVTITRIWHGAYIDIQTHLRVDEICAGSCVAIAHHYRILADRKFAPALLVTALLLLFVASWPGSAWPQYLRPYCSGLLLTAAVLLQGSSFMWRVLASKPASYIAAISYALYVIHPIAAHGFMDTGATALKYLVKRPISIAATFLLAHLSTFHFENRFIALAKRYGIKEKPGVLQATPQ